MLVSKLFLSELGAVEGAQRCVAGSPLLIKTRHGTGYSIRFRLCSMVGEEKAKVVERFRSAFPKSILLVRIKWYHRNCVSQRPDET